jgi:cell division septal protein FtsQ
MRKLPSIAGFVWVLASLVLAVGVCAAARAATGFTPFVLREVEVEGVRRTAPAEVLAAAELQRGAGLFSVEVNEVRRRAEALPWVRQARVLRRLPGTIRLELTEWEPKYLIRLDRLYYLTAEAHVVRAPLEYGLDYPVVTGLKAADLEGSSELRAALLELLTQLEQNFDGERLSEIHADPLAGFTIYDTARPTKGVFVGFGSLGEKFARLARLERHLKRRGQSARFVNLDHADKIIARLLPAEAKGATP